MPRWLPRSAGVAVALVVLAFSATPANAASPINGANRPNVLSGQTNGRVDGGQLIRVTVDCQVARAAGPSLAALLASAKARGVPLAPNDCYRPLDDQVSVGRNWTNAGNSACAAQPTSAPNGTVVGTSMHGWGKAVDFSMGGSGFSAPGYRYLKSAAASYGWNHPAWAEPGGSACPEAWHWEWVGDGGQMALDRIRADVVGLVPSADEGGYALVTGLGAVSTHGNAVNQGAADSLPINWVMVGSSPTADRGGYWMVGADGGVFGFGNAQFYGSTGAMHLNQQIVGMAATPSGHGYWLVAGDGGVFSFGDARFFGSTGAMHLNKSVVGMAATPDGGGYWLVASDGGIFSFGNAGFHGSTGAMKLNQPVTAMSSAPSGGGYWLVASDGGIFSFGNAGFHGSSGAAPPPGPVIALTRTQDGGGYWMTVANGDIYAYGNARFFGTG